MRSIILILVWLPCLTALGADREPKDLADALSKGWSVVRVSHYHFMGDFDQEYPVLFFQHLPNDQILLSVAVQRRWGRLIPKPLRFIAADEWQKLKGEIVGHYSTAHTSEPDAQLRKNAFGSDFRSIEISISGLETKQFSHRFSQADDSSKRFRVFLEKLTAHPGGTEQDGAEGNESR